MSFDIKMPQGAELIIHKLQSSGYEAYIVGGCVRDSILGKSAKDWDITTSALPEQIIEIFHSHKIIPTGLKHGTVTIGAKGDFYEVTTYRIDGVYTDGRRPDEVSFTTNLMEDLRRRDFTINAMAYNQKDGVIDYFDGMNDLNNRSIRCVGSAEARFSEDYLRMLRAYRFAAVLDFDMCADVREAALKNKVKILDIAAERIQVEFNKLILSPCFDKIKIFLDDFSDTLFPEIHVLKGFEQNNPFHYLDVYDHSFEVFKNTQSDLVMRLCALFHDTGKFHTKSVDDKGVYHFYTHDIKSADITDKRLKTLKYDNETREAVVGIIKNHSYNVHPYRKNVKKYLNKLGENLGRCVLAFQASDTMGKSEYAKEQKLPAILQAQEMLEEIIAYGEPFQVKSLMVNGKIIMETTGLKPGREIKEVLDYLVETVIEQPDLNNYDDLINLIKGYKNDRL